jgi:hypothetical protein
MRRLPLLLAILMAFAIIAPTQAQAFKPEIVYVRATDDNEGIRFTAKVRMDKGGRNERKVWVTYDGERKSAKVLKEPPLSLYETGAFSIPVRKCYRVTVKARNQYGTTTKKMRADLIGTEGCD